MKLLVTVQRYGEDVLGGAELLARDFATNLVGRGHEVEVLTSCAQSYLTWANVFPAGTSQVDGVTVHRLPAARTRDLDFFGRLSGRVIGRQAQVAYHVQREWMRAQGPVLEGLETWLRRRSPDFDAALFVTYLYHPTWHGIAYSRVPTVLFPTAHDEPPFRLPLFESEFRAADGFAFLTEEEAEAVHRRFRIHRPSEVVGTGIPLDVQGDGDAFRRRFGLGERPYVLFAGRIDPNKGALDLYQYFTAFKRRRPGPLALVMVGEEVTPIPAHPDVITTGFVDDAVRDAGLLGATALVVPSYFESFSYILAEGWAAGIPALVQARSEVLLGQCRRSHGGLAFRDEETFAAGLERLLESPELRRRLGESGRAYVRDRYRWDSVLAKLERLLERVVSGHEQLAGSVSPSSSRP
ncbi:MAG TPA: glycosyltransferase family 4 protein [Candidatus Dormibacteraeota bacterium]